MGAGMEEEGAPKMVRTLGTLPEFLKLVNSRKGMVGDWFWER